MDHRHTGFQSRSVPEHRMASKAENWPAHLLDDPDVLRLDPEGWFVVCRTCRTYQQVHGGRDPQPLRMTSRFSLRAWNIHKRRSMAHTRRDRAWRALARSARDREREHRPAPRDTRPMGTASPVYSSVSVLNLEVQRPRTGPADPSPRRIVMRDDDVRASSCVDRSDTNQVRCQG